MKSKLAPSAATHRRMSLYSLGYVIVYTTPSWVRIWTSETRMRPCTLTRSWFATSIRPSMPHAVPSPLLAACASCKSSIRSAAAPLS